MSLSYISEQDFLNILKNLSLTTIWITYFVLGIVSFLENVIPPIPGDTIIIIGSVLVGMKTLNFYILFIITSTFSTLGFIFMFYLGRLLGKEFFIRKKWISEKNFNYIISFFKKRAYFLILFNRYVVTFRSMIAIITGILGMNPKKVFVLCSISSFTWNYLLIYLGYQAGSNWGDIISLLKKYNLYFVMFISLLLIGFFIFYFFFKGRKLKKE